MDYLEVRCLVSRHLEDFPDTFLLLIFNLIPLWIENILCMTRVLLNLRLVVWSRILCALEKNMYSAAVGYSVPFQYVLADDFCLLVL